MVWFQCEDCGENLKKPKLANHFNRCSAHKLSCIDCGVVFDQYSVQAHTSCVSEVEKYGPKGVSNPASASTSKQNVKAKNGQDVDLSRGLTQRPPWSCTLCNVKATSWETLETHAQGKKHRSKAKAAAVKDAPSVDAGAVVDTVEGGNCLSAGTAGSLVSKCSAVASPPLEDQPLEKKRKNEQVDGPREAEREFKSTKKEKKAKKEVENSNGASLGSPNKKRKHLEEERHKVTESKANGKKSKIKDKGSAPEENGHFGTILKVVSVEGLDQQEKKKKDKKQKKGKKGREEPVNSKEDSKIVGENGSEDALVNGASSPHGADIDRQRLTLVTPKKVKKTKSPNVAEEPLTPEAPVTSQNKHKTSGGRSGRNEETPRKEKETLVHEVSFREWLGDDDTGGNGGTPTHPPILNKGVEDTSTRPVDLDSEQSHAVSKVVKWKKVISEALGKSLDGRMKRKDLSKAVLTTALKAAEASSIPLDRMVLKEELMRQIKSNSKFVLDGKYVVLASGGK